MARLLSNLKEKAVDLRPCGRRKGGFCRDPAERRERPSSAATSTDRPPASSRDDTGRRSRHIRTKMRRPRHYRA